MPVRPELRIPVFMGCENVTILRATSHAVLDFGGSKIFPKEFHIKVKAKADESFESVLQKINLKEKEILDRFPNKEHLYLSTRRQYWERFAFDDKSEVVYQATISATQVQIISAVDEHTSLEIKA